MAQPTKYIALAEQLIPKNVENLEKASQAEILERFTRGDETVGTKTATLGAKGEACFDEDKGFFSTVIEAYNNHWVLKTSPEDWWFCITHKVAKAIDKHANTPEVRKFFVQHEGKKDLTVTVGPSIYGVDYSWFFTQMAGEIEKNINVPEYVTIMDADFTKTSPVQNIVNKVVLMASMQEYFRYKMMLGCGIPGVIMTGSHDDWQRLGLKLRKLEKLLKPIERTLQLDGWWGKCSEVCNKLVDTYQGSSDKDWWSRIITKERFGSGGQVELKGWFVSQFLDISFAEEKDIQSGLVAVPMIITDGATEDHAAVVAGIAGYKVNKEEVRCPNSGSCYPSVEAVHTWALMMETGAVFRRQLVSWQENIVGA